MYSSWFGFGFFYFAYVIFLVGPVRPTPRPPPTLQDPLSLASQFGERLNLGTAVPPAVSSAASSSAFSALPNSNFRNMAPSPGSPSRMFGAPGAPVQTPDGGSSPLFNPPTSGNSRIIFGTFEFSRQLRKYDFPQKFDLSRYFDFGFSIILNFRNKF